MSITIFLVSDHAGVRGGLQIFLELQADFKIVGEGSHRYEVAGQIADLRPDVVIIDGSMPELADIKTTQQIHELCPASQLILLSLHARIDQAFRAFQIGAQGYLLKESVCIELVNAVHTVHAGQRYLSQEISD